MMTEAADMPLSGHLTELRKRLIYSFLAIAVGTAVSFFFIRELMAFLTAPAGQLYFARPASSSPRLWSSSNFGVSCSLH